jgi:hypothetical protein
MFTSVIEILPVNLVQLLLASVMLFTVFLYILFNEEPKASSLFCLSNSGLFNKHIGR